MNNTEILPGGTLFFTSENHPVTTDSSLLARFAAAGLASGALPPHCSVCDLGSGNGMLLLYLVDAGLYGRAVGVERDSEAAGLLRAAVELGELVNVACVEGDLRDYTGPARFDLVITNPPYFTSGPLPQSPARAAARHQTGATLAEVAAAAARLLKDDGRLCLCYPAAQRATLLATLAAHGFALRALQQVRATPEAEPWLLLLDARKGGGETLETLPDLILAAGEAGPQP